MGWSDEYDNAERALFFTEDQVLSSGKKVKTLVKGFCQAWIAGKGYIETLPQPVALNNTDGVTGEVDGRRLGTAPNKFLTFQLTETDSPRSYNSSDEKLALFGKFDGV